MEKTGLKVIYEELGSNIVSIMKANPETTKVVRKLEYLAKKFNAKNSGNLVLRKGYVGYVMSSLNGDNPNKKLDEYVKLVEERLRKNPFTASCPEFIHSFYNEVFQS